MSILEEKAVTSRTTRLWLDAFIKPVLIMLLFIRAEREGEWPLHLLAVSRMLPYFAAACHWNYLRYGVVYLKRMTKMPHELLEHFLNKEHVMRHQPGLWNAIWSDMMIETTVMRYGHGPEGVIGLTLNQKALERWALSLHITTQLQKDFMDLDDKANKNHATTHKEESNSRIRSDTEDRIKIRSMLDTCISPLCPDEHPRDIVNVVTGQLASDAVNVYKALEMGTSQLQNFTSSLPEGFYAPLSKKVITMISMKKSVKFDDVDVVDTALIYSRVKAMQATRETPTMKDVLEYELAAIPTSMFKDTGVMRLATNKAVLKNKLSNEVSARLYMVPESIVMDGCALMWILQWPSRGGTIADIVKHMTEYVVQKLNSSHVYLVFDRYYDFSMKSAARAEREISACRVHKLTRQTPLPPRNVVLTNRENKVQLIDIICTDVVQHVQSMNMSHTLVVTGRSHVPEQVLRGEVTNRPDIRSTHEEADIMLVQQVVHAVQNCDSRSVKVISDDTDVFVLLLHYCWKLDLTTTLTMEATSGDRKLIDICKTTEQHRDIVPNLLAAHALSGCDTVAQFHGIGKATILKKLKAGFALKAVGIVEANIEDVLRESTLIISSCYQHQCNQMTEARIKAWSTKTGKARKTAPTLASLPPTTESFTENVKRAHLQAIHWNSVLSADPPSLDPTVYGWERDEKTKSLSPVGIPPHKSAAPKEVLDMIKCSCRSQLPCTTNRCKCSAANLPCTILCHCQGNNEVCCNEHTHHAQSASDDEQEGDSDIEDSDTL